MSSSEQREQVQGVDPAIYQRIFQQDPDGMKILAELVARFYDQPGYVPGGSATDAVFADGQRDVLRFIIDKAAY